MCKQAGQLKLNPEVENRAEGKREGKSPVLIVEAQEAAAKKAVRERQTKAERSEKPEIYSHLIFAIQHSTLKPVKRHYVSYLSLTSNLISHFVDGESRLI